MTRAIAAAVAATALLCSFSARAADIEIIPPGAKIRQDRPRMLLRAKGSPMAVGLDQLKALKRDSDFEKGLATLKAQKRANAQALVWLLTGDESAADKAIDRLNSFVANPRDAFDVWFGLRELSLAYDWLHGHPKFTAELKAKVRDKAFVLADKWGVPRGNDHVFHNYTWMNNCGLAMWALASYGDDPRSEKLMDIVRDRLNGQMFPAMEHLAGLPGDAMGYWYIYCPAAGIWTLMATQSAFETDVCAAVRDRQRDWLTLQLEGMIQGTMPNMRFMPWGDIQTGADGGATHEIAGLADAVTWATKNPHGVFFGNWLASKRGMARFHGEMAILYFLYTRHISTAPAEPPLAMLVGGRHSGQAMMRSAWSDDATVAGFRCTDYYQGHFHYDVGSFVIYRHGLLAVDAGRYTVYSKTARAPMIATNAHNTLLLGGKGQREVEGQWYKNLAEFTAALSDRRDNRRLERGDVPFFKHAGEWTAVAGQFAQAYAPGAVESCARQMLFVRPNTFVIVDNLAAAAGRKVPEVAWLLQTPSAQPEVGKGCVTATNTKSWLRCRDLLSEAEPTVEPAPETQLTDVAGEHSAVSRVKFVYQQQPGPVVLVHLIEVGDGQPTPAGNVTPKVTDDAVEVTVAGKTFTFSRKAPFEVTGK